MPNLSIIPASAVMDRDLTPTQLRVLCAIGIHTDKLGGNVWASVRTMAGEAGVAERTFQAACAALVERGYLRITDRPGRTNLYQVVLEPTLHGPPQQLVHPTPAIADAPKRPQGTTQHNEAREVTASLLEIYPERPEEVPFAAALKVVTAALKGGAESSQLWQAASRYHTHCQINRTEPQYVKSFLRFFGPDGFWKSYQVQTVHGRTRAEWVASGQDGTKWDRLLAGEPYEEVMAG